MEFNSKARSTVGREDNKKTSESRDCLSGPIQLQDAHLSQDASSLHPVLGHVASSCEADGIVVLTDGDLCLATATRPQLIELALNVLLVGHPFLGVPCIHLEGVGLSW